MSFNGTEYRLPTSYAELDGVEVKISEKYRVETSPRLPEVDMGCMTLKDLDKLDQFQYDFATELEVLQNQAHRLKDVE